MAISFPLSLEDMCMIHILFHLEDYPVETLALLPRKIRRKLYLSISHADLLHLEDTALFCDIDAGDMSSQDETLPSRASLARKELLGMVLDGKVYNLGKFLSLNFLSALVCFKEHKYFTGEDTESIVKHISANYPSLPSAAIPDNSAIIPTTRFQQYISDLEQPWLTSASALTLLRYCNIQTAPKELSIDCCGLSQTPFWKDFNDRFEAATEELLASGSTVIRVRMDPFIPFAQDFFSSVEVLELGTHDTPGSTNYSDLVETVSLVSYVILYNIVTSKHPHLKHLKLHGIPLLMELMTSILSNLLTNTATQDPFSTHCDVPLQLASAAPHPYHLEGLSVLPYEPDWGYPYDYMVNYIARTIAISTEAIVAFQLNSLKHVTIQGLGFCYGDEFSYRDIEDRMDHGNFGKRNYNVPEYRKLLSTAVTDLLKQPQLQSLCISHSPLPEAYELIETFLCTQTTHEQSLTIVGIDETELEEKESDQDEDEDDEEDEEDEDWEMNEEDEVDEEYEEDDDEDLLAEVVEEDVNEEEITQEQGKEEEEEEEQEEEESEEDEESGDETGGKKRGNITILTYGQSKKIKKTSPQPTIRPPPSQPLPEYNSQFKCLDLGRSSKCVHTWLFSIPGLKLKRLRTLSTELVPSNLSTMVEVSDYDPW